MGDRNKIRRKREKVLNLSEKRRMSQELGWQVRSQAETPVVEEESETTAADAALLVRDTERLLLERRILEGGEDMESAVVEVEETAGDKRMSGGGSSSQSTKVVKSGMSVRCHCNLASCVTTNYMCKSQVRVGEDGKLLEAACFVEELDTDVAAKSSQVPLWNGRVTTARRGCVDLLPKEKQQRCKKEPLSGEILCCTQDMCNYPKSFYPSSASSSIHQQQMPPRYNPGLAGPSSMGGMRNPAGVGMIPNMDHQVWLRAAVIAVPVCGLFILIALIVVARRLLQGEDYKDPERPCNGRPKSTSSGSSSTGLPSFSPYAPTNGYIPSGGRMMIPQPSVHSPPFVRGSSAYGGHQGAEADLMKGYGTETSELLSSPSSEYQYCVNCQGHVNGASLGRSRGHHEDSNRLKREQDGLLERSSDAEEAEDCFTASRSNGTAFREVAGSLPVLPCDGSSRRFAFLNKLGLSRSIESANECYNNV